MTSNQNFTVEFGESTIQALSSTILENNLYRDENGLNYIIAKRGSERSEGSYVRLPSYVLLRDSGVPIALCMVVECPELSNLINVDELSFYADSFFSVFVKEQYRKQGIAQFISGELAKHIKGKLRQKAQMYSRYFVAADPNGVGFARANFNIPFICAGFSVSAAVKRVAIRYSGEDVPADDHYFNEPRYVETKEEMELEFERCEPRPLPLSA